MRLWSRWPPINGNRRVFLNFKTPGVLTLSLLIGLARPASLPAREMSEMLITVENADSRNFCDIFLSRAGLDRFPGQGLLGGDYLSPGERRDFALKLTAEPHDLLVLLEDGSARRYLMIDLSRYRYLSLGEGQAELFEWDPLIMKPRP